MSKSQRKRDLAERRREAARRLFPAIFMEAERVLCRDGHMNHVSVWPTAGADPVQWYPTAAKWGVGQRLSHHGEANAFLAWLRNEVAGVHRPRRAADDFDVIDEEDVPQ